MSKSSAGLLKKLYALKPLIWSAFFVCFWAACPVYAEMPKVDIEGTQDYAAFPRFKDSVIVAYEVKEWDASSLVSGLVAMGQNANGDNAPISENMSNLEGKITRIAYNFPASVSALDVFNYYQDLLKKAEFKDSFLCAKDACGDALGLFMKNYKLMGTFNATKTLDNSTMNTFDTRSAHSEPRYVLAEGHNASGAVLSVAIYVVPPEGGEPGGVYFEVVEPKPMPDDMVVGATSDEIDDGLNADGYVALYSLFFDKEKGVLRPEATSTLQQIASLMESKKNLRLYVVGHTDNQGSFEQNLAFSQKNAEAVVSSLVTTYHVDPERLIAKGVASLAPVASNENEVGREKNRRVELVRF